jgi:hypothetical protein
LIGRRIKLLPDAFAWRAPIRHCARWAAAEHHRAILLIEQRVRLALRTVRDSASISNDEVLQRHQCERSSDWREIVPSAYKAI